MSTGALAPGDRVLLVEDIATTCGLVVEAAGVVTEAGAVVARIVAVVDRMDGAVQNIGAAGFEFTSLLNAADLRLPGSQTH